MGFDIHFSEASSQGPLDDERFANALQKSIVPVVLPIELSRDGLPRVTPLPEFSNYARVGAINITLDSGGVARTILPAAIDSFDYVLSGSTKGQTTRRIAYTGPAHTYLQFSVSDLLDGSIPPSVLKGSTVLVGATALSLHDTVLTPFGNMSGVEVHANSIETIGNDIRFSESTPLTAGVAILLSALLTLLVLYATKRNFFLLILSLSLLAVSVVPLAVLLFTYHIVIPFLYIFLAITLTSGAGIALMYITESKEKAFIRKSFQYYLMPEIVDELVRNPKRLALGGETRKVTIFFSDIRGFTTLSEGMSPETLTAFINEYLTAMTDIIMKHGGLVDKYIGDAIMAFWGAPLENQNQEVQAVKAYIEMRHTLLQLNEQWLERGLPPLTIGAGIATGDVVAGNMGSSKRFNYTLMGDEVNFASRIESLTKVYGVDCLLAQATAEAVARDGYSIREIDLVKVKGKKEPRKLFALAPTSPTQIEQLMLNEFRKGYAAYKEGAWQEAVDAFSRALSHIPDGPSTTLLERTKKLQASPPSSWNGVYAHESK